ncbi:MAG TPA: ABC transporter ATP-binding protein [Acidimicrobiales bacterium]|nr:ABC transporter ATP-binding protein [Acidimicrobiales bacterium]
MGRVAFTGVTKRFGDVEAVRDLTLEVADREFLVLLGPSGCGKSTALRMVAGLEEPTAGTVEIGPRVVNDVEPKERDVAMVFQSYALYPHMNVWRNIEFPLKSRGVPKPERDALVKEAAESLGLGDLLDRKPAQMSGGQRQRVALARAIVRRPQAFLMDEPLSNLDAKLRLQTRTELIEMQRRLAITVLYVTHDQVEGMTMGHRVAIMDNGVLQQLAPPVEVYEHPANLFVAGFVGSPPMNTITGTPLAVGDELVIETGSGRIPLPAAHQDAVRRSGAQQVVVGVRPERVVIDGEGPLPAVVAVVESLGYERHVICRLADGQQVVVRLPGDVPAPAEGEAVHLSTAEDHLHLFEAVTGARIGA